MRESNRIYPSYLGRLFVLPTFLVLCLFVIYPLIYTLVLSITSSSGSFIGASNFGRLFSDPSIWGVFNNSFIFTAGSVILQIGLGFIVGVILNQPFTGRGVVRGITLIPWVIPASVAATTWAWMYHTDFGIINYMLKQIGLITVNKGWLADPKTVMPALIVVNTWKMVPFVAVMVLAGLQSIDTTLYEAARVDGANFLHEIRYVTLPHLRAVLLSILLVLTIWGFNAITIIFTMTKGGPADKSLVAPLHIFRTAFQYFDFNLAAAESIVLFVVIGIIIFIYIKVFSPLKEEQVV